jgi:hypothetical protein
MLSLSRLISIHTFLFVLFLLVFIGLVLVRKVDPEKVGMTFLVGAVLKILASASFIMIVALPKTSESLPFAYHFFAIFFPVLILDSILVVKKVVQS